MSANSPSESSFEQLFRNYRRRARENGRRFTLSRSQFRALTQSPCFYCGAAPRQRYRRTGGKRAYVYNGIDRVDNNLGYSEPNTVACCWRCNEWKRALPVETFLGHVARIAANTISRFSRRG